MKGLCMGGNKKKLRRGKYRIKIEDNIGGRIMWYNIVVK